MVKPGNVTKVRSMKVYLKVLFPVKHYGLGFDFPILDVNLVSTQDNGDVFAYPHQVSVPVGDILVCDAGSHVKHDDCTLA